MFLQPPHLSSPSVRVACAQALRHHGLGALEDCQMPGEGSQAVVLFPECRPDLVIKIMPHTPGDDRRIYFDNEIKEMRELSGLSGPGFRMPQLVADDKDSLYPSFTMTRLGPTLAGLGGGPAGAGDRAIGHAVGAYAAEIWRRGLVNFDLNPGNITIEPDGGIGILDCASVARKKGYCSNFLDIHPLYNFTRLANDASTLLIAVAAVDEFQRRAGQTFQPSDYRWANSGRGGGSMWDKLLAFQRSKASGVDECPLSHRPPLRRIMLDGQVHPGWD